MGAFVLYILEWSACLLGFMFLYKMCFSGTTFHRFNRFYLLGAVVLSAILPLIHIAPSEQVEPMAEVCRNVVQVEETSFNDISVNSALDANTDSLTPLEKVAITLLVIYMIYVLVQLTGWAKSMLKMLHFFHGKRRHKLGKGVWLVEHDGDYGPFSWMNYIVMSSKEHGLGRRASMRHELSHIVLLHHIDLLFLMVCVIINPTCWMVMNEIKIIHEYEADDEVINHYRIQSRDYQRLLIMRTVGAEAYALASSFNLNIKKRIIMMKKKQSHWWRMIWIAVTIPLMGLALMAFSKPKEALKEAVDNSVRIIEQPIVEVVNAEVLKTENTDEIETLKEPIQEEVTQEKESDVKPGETVSGTVSDKDGKPFQSCNVIELDENGRVVARSVTDVNGKYSLKVVDHKHKLRFSYVGYKTKTVDISSEKIDVVLEQALILNDVKVVGRRDNSAVTDSSRYKKQTYSNDPNVFHVVEQAPVFPGGQEGIMTYLSRNLRYPSVAREMQVEADIVVEFMVDKTGVVRGPHVISYTSTPLISAETAKAAKDGDPEAVEAAMYYYDAIEALKEEANYVVRQMPRWEPGRQNGQRVNTTFTLPISFKLQQ
ncbi:MAG: energy transducer TonB [Bacteroidaceae bacterium]|nr:energy transducer TonB [Bacteroidaceae bacterium]